MKVLIWHWGRRGGGSRYTYELAKALGKRRELDLSLSISRQSELVPDFMALNLPTLQVDTYSGALSALLAIPRLPLVRNQFTRWLREQQFDVVVCTMSHLWDVFMLGPIKQHARRYVLVLHDAVPHPGENYLVRKSMLAREVRAADGIVALTENVRRTLCAEYSYPENRTRVIPHGVFSYHEANNARSYPEGRAFRLLFFGRVLPYKGLDLMLSVYRDLVSRGYDLNLTIAGPGDISPYRKQLEDLRGLSLINRWISEEEIGDFFSSADLVVTPYVEASQSGVIATAYAAGIPVVATPVGGLSDQVVSGETGFVASAVTSQAVTEGVLRLFKNPDVYRHCSAGALREAKTRLSWDVIAKSFATVFQDIQKSSAMGQA